MASSSQMLSRSLRSKPSSSSEPMRYSMTVFSLSVSTCMSICSFSLSERRWCLHIPFPHSRHFLGVVTVGIVVGIWSSCPMLSRASSRLVFSFFFFSLCLVSILRVVHVCCYYASRLRRAESSLATFPVEHIVSGFSLSKQGCRPIRH